MRIETHLPCLSCKLYAISFQQNVLFAALEDAFESLREVQSALENPSPDSSFLASRVSDAQDFLVAAEESRLDLFLRMDDLFFSLILEGSFA